MAKFAHADPDAPVYAVRCDCGEIAVYEAWFKLKRSLCRDCFKAEGHSIAETRAIVGEPPFRG